MAAEKRDLIFDIYLMHIWLARTIDCITCSTGNAPGITGNVEWIYLHREP